VVRALFCSISKGGRRQDPSPLGRPGAGQAAARSCSASRSIAGAPSRGRRLRPNPSVSVGSAHRPHGSPHRSPSWHCRPGGCSRLIATVPSCTEIAYGQPDLTCPRTFVRETLWPGWRGCRFQKAPAPASEGGRTDHWRPTLRRGRDSVADAPRVPRPRARVSLSREIGSTPSAVGWSFVAAPRRPIRNSRMPEVANPRLPP
jgi:hypothetical protein